MTTPDPISLVEERLIAAGRKTKRAGDKITAQCPAHEDRAPSLSVSVGTRGRDVVVHCHAGCRPDAIMAALDIKWTDFGTSNPRESPTTTWIYHGPDGRPLYRVAKYPNKQFRQHAYDPTTGEWLKKLGSVERVPYRLPELRKAIADGETIWIAEGEKDVDALVDHGAVATCNSGGAGKFTPTVARQFVGASDVIIVADRDEAGTEHAADVAAKLAAVGVTSRTVVAAEGKDAYDHFAFGHTLDAFAAPVEVTVDELAASEDPDDQLRALLIDWPDFWEQDHGDAEWLAEPVIPAKRSVALFAPGGTGKSLLALWLSVHLAVGIDPFSGRRQKPLHVLYLDYEMTSDDLAERLEQMGFGAECDLSRLHYALLPSLPGLDQPEGGKAVVRLAEIVGADLVVIDTFGRAVHGDENEADTVRAWYRWTGLHLKHAGRAFLRVDHAGKDISKGQRGTSAKNDDVDVVWQMTAQEGDTYKLTAKKRRMGWVPEVVKIAKIDDRILKFGLLDGETYPAGTQEMAKRLEDLGVAVDDSSRVASRALREAGGGGRDAVIRAAQKYRKVRSSTLHFAGDDPTTDGAKARPDKSGRGQVNGHPAAPRAAGNEIDEYSLVDGAGRAAGRGGPHPPAASGPRRRSIERPRPADPEPTDDWEF